jgi:hypothetical protein
MLAKSRAQNLNKCFETFFRIILCFFLYIFSLKKSYALPEMDQNKILGNTIVILLHGHEIINSLYTELKKSTMVHIHAHNVHAHNVHAHNVHAHNVHAHNVHAHNVHAHNVHAHNVHAHNVHAHNVHAHITAPLNDIISIVLCVRTKWMPHTP